MKIILVVILYTIYAAVCFQFINSSSYDCENILLRVIIIVKSEKWIISYFMFKVRSRNIGMRFISCYVFVLFFFSFLLHALVKMLIVDKV